MGFKERLGGSLSAGRMTWFQRGSSFTREAALGQRLIAASKIEKEFVIHVHTQLVSGSEGRNPKPAFI
ncbi:MAG: hypothetical protein ACRECP_08005, partial [Methylocella sp.]